MTDSQRGRFTRRAFLRTTAVGGAAIGVAAASPGWFTGTPTTDTRSDAVSSRSEGIGTAPASGQPLVALVRDASKGEIVVLWGEQEIVVTDADLAARLSQASNT